MKVLITGSYGFIGYNVALRLLGQGCEVIGIDRVNTAISQKEPRIEDLSKWKDFHHEEADLRDGVLLERIVKSHKPDVVIHFAAQYAVPLRDKATLDRYMWSNCEGFSNILWAAKEGSVRRVIYASSTFVEDGMLSTHTYGATKHFNEHMANVFAQNFGMRIVGIRYGSTFGPWCRPDVGASLVMKRIMGQEVHPNRGGYLYKSAMLWSEDAVTATLKAVRREFENNHEVFTLVMNDERYSLADFAREASAYAGMPLILPTEGFRDKPGGGGRPTKELEHMRQLLGWVPGVDFRTAVHKFVDWYRESRGGRLR